MRLIDTHCHLDFNSYDGLRDEIVREAAGAGVTRILNPGTDLDRSRAAVELAARYPGVYAAVAIHPNSTAAWSDGWIEALRALAAQPKVVAIGEIGLDYYWERVAHDQQQQALRSQLALAAELGLPVILHTRNAQGSASPDAPSCTADLLWEIEQWVRQIPTQPRASGIVGVWHAFSGTLDDAQRAYETGLVLGLGGPVTFQNARRLHALVPQLRPDRLVLETDAPYLAPHPHRGQRNEPAYVPLIVRSLARLFETTIDKVVQVTEATTRQCFGTRNLALPGAA